MRLSATLTSIAFLIVSLSISFGLLASEPADRDIYITNDSDEEIKTATFFSEDDFQPDINTIAFSHSGFFQSFYLMCYPSTTASATCLVFSFISSRAPPA